MNTLASLADALRRWAACWQTEEYRRRRGEALLAFLRKGPPLKRRGFLFYERLILDRVIPVGGGLEVWLLDAWYLWPEPDDPEPRISLDHGLQVVVCRAGLRELPMPAYEGPAEHMLIDDRTREVFVGVPIEPAWNAGSVRFQCLALAFPPTFKARRKGRWPWQARSSIRIGGGRRELLAQLALLAIRQGFEAEAAYEWLTRYVGKSVPQRAKPYARAAVNNAVMHYLHPRGSLWRYLRKVTSAMAHDGEPPGEVLTEATQLGVSVRTVYAWRAQGLLEADREARALRLVDRRARSNAAQALAEQTGISYHAARMRLRRATQ